MDMRDVKHITFPRSPRLPEAYQEVAYLRTNADGYIETGYAFTEPELKVEFKYMKESVLTTNLFGVRIRKTKGGRANLYMRSDWEEARRQAALKKTNQGGSLKQKREN